MSPNSYPQYSPPARSPSITLLPLHFLSPTLPSLSVMRSAALSLKVVPVRGLVSSCLDGWVEQTALAQLGTGRLLVTLTISLPGGLDRCASFLCSHPLLSITKSVTQRGMQGGGNKGVGWRGDGMNLIKCSFKWVYNVNRQRCLEMWVIVQVDWSVVRKLRDKITYLFLLLLFGSLATTFQSYQRSGCFVFF